VTPDFHLTVVRDGPEDGAPTLRIQTSRATSLGSIPDGSILVAMLGTVGQEAAASVLAQAFRDDPYQQHCSVRGTASCVVLDQRSGTVIAIAPPIGHQQVFWSSGANSINFASRPVVLADLSDAPPKIRLDALFQYVYFRMVPSPDTIFENIYKLDGGHRLRWEGGETRATRYWQPQFNETATFTESEASAELHRVLRLSVERALGSTNAAGTFLSGGLDSSSVTGFAAQCRPGITSVTMGFAARGYDETEYARIASRKFGTTPLEYCVTPDAVLSTLQTISAAFPEPFGNSSAAAVYHCGRVSRECGLDLLLAGDGGDELFGGNERYAKQMIFERYRKIPGTVRRAVIEPLLQGATQVTSAFPIGKAASYVQQANIPLPDRLESYNFLHRHAPEEIFAEELLAQVDSSAPLQQLRDEFSVPNNASTVNRMMFLDWKFTLHDNDLVKVNNMCRLAGIDVAYPMLDTAVIDFSLRLPGDWKVRRGQLRWFYRRAMRHFLPHEIIKKKKHGFGLPFGVWTRTHDGLRRLSEDALAALGERGYFRPEFLQHALRLHRYGHASYYGELVWILMVLEFWLQKHLPTARL